jgi:predicted dehydrogenase
VLGSLDIKPALLVDINLPRAQTLADSFHALRASDDYRSCLGEFDAAIVASPHHLHAPICVDLLRRGIHVLVEKPMAMTAGECHDMNAAAEEGKAVLAVGLMRRYQQNIRWAKAVLDAGVLGSIESFDFQEGSVYGWPVASGFFFRKETAGGGVLMDTGAHTLDLLLWWLGDVVSFEYYDDSYGGVEADCKLHLMLTSGASGVVELSRTRDLRNSAILRGKRGEIEVGLGNRKYVSASSKEILAYSDGTVKSDPEVKQLFRDLYVSQLKDWLRAIETGQVPCVAGTEAARSVRFIEACYARRQEWKLPWVMPDGRQSETCRLASAKTDELVGVGDDK